MVLAYIARLNDPDNSIKRTEKLLKDILVKMESMSVRTIEDIVSRITNDYTPSREQAENFFRIIGKKCTYQSDYIDMKFLRCLDDEPSAENNPDAQCQNKKIKGRRLNAQDLKKYIFKNRKIGFILENIGCKDVVYMDGMNGSNTFTCSFGLNGCSFCSYVSKTIEIQKDMVNPMMSLTFSCLSCIISS